MNSTASLKTLRRQVADARKRAKRTGLQVDQATYSRLSAELSAAESAAPTATAFVVPDEIGNEVAKSRVPWADQDADDAREGYQWAHEGTPCAIDMTGPLERFAMRQEDETFAGAQGDDRYWMFVRKEAVDWYDGQSDDSLQNRMDYAAAVHQACAPLRESAHALEGRQWAQDGRPFSNETEAPNGEVYPHDAAEVTGAVDFFQKLKASGYFASEQAEDRYWAFVRNAVIRWDRQCNHGNGLEFHRNLAATIHERCSPLR